MFLRAVVLLVIGISQIATAGSVEDQVWKGELKKLQDIRASRKGADSLKDYFLSESGTYQLDCLAFEGGQLIESQKLFASAPKFKIVKAPVVYWELREDPNGLSSEEYKRVSESLSTSKSAKTAVLAVENRGFNSLVTMTTQADDTAFQMGDSKISVYFGIGGIPIFHFKLGGTDLQEICTAKNAASAELLPSSFQPKPKSVSHFFFKEASFDQGSLSSIIQVSLFDDKLKDGAALIEAPSNQVKFEPVGGDTARVFGNWMGVEVNALASYDWTSGSAVFVGLSAEVPARYEIDLRSGKLTGTAIPRLPPVSYQFDCVEGATLSQVWVTSVIYSMTLFAEQVRKLDDRVRIGDVVWVRDPKRSLKSGLVLNVDDKSGSVSILPGNFHSWSSTHHWPIDQVMKTVLALDGFSVGEVARWGNLYPRKVRVDRILSDGTAWITVLERKEEKVIYLSELSKLE